MASLNIFVLLVIGFIAMAYADPDPAAYVGDGGLYRSGFLGSSYHGSNYRSGYLGSNYYGSNHGSGYLGSNYYGSGYSGINRGYNYSPLGLGYNRGYSSGLYSGYANRGVVY